MPKNNIASLISISGKVTVCDLINGSKRLLEKEKAMYSEVIL